MNGMEKIIGLINAKSDAQCDEIASAAQNECERLRSGYSKIEQDEYWKSIDSGSSVAERRMEELTALAESEADKQISITQQEMVSEAFALAAVKLCELPESEFTELLSRLKLNPGASAGDIVDMFRDLLSQPVKTVLFD